MLQKKYSSILYTIYPFTGVATQVSTLNVSLNGSRFGLDFNPVPIVADREQYRPKSAGQRR